MYRYGSDFIEGARLSHYGAIHTTAHPRQEGVDRSRRRGIAEFRRGLPRDSKGDPASLPGSVLDSGLRAEVERIEVPVRFIIQFPIHLKWGCDILPLSRASTYIHRM